MAQVGNTTVFLLNDVRCAYPQTTKPIDVSGSVSETSRKRDLYKSFGGAGSESEAPCGVGGRFRKAARTVLGSFRLIPASIHLRDFFFLPPQQQDELRKNSSPVICRELLRFSRKSLRRRVSASVMAGPSLSSSLTAGFVGCYRSLGSEPRSTPAAPSQNENLPHFDDVSLRIVSLTVNHSVFVILNSELQRDNAPKPNREVRLTAYPNSRPCFDLPSYHKSIGTTPKHLVPKKDRVNLSPWPICG